MHTRRKASEAFENEEVLTPHRSKRVQLDINNDDDTILAVPSPSLAADSPSKRKSILRAPGTPSKFNGVIGLDGEATPKSLRKVLFSTPTGKRGVLDKPDLVPDDQGTPVADRNDRSARKKSRQALRIQPLMDEESDGDDAVDEAIAREILEDEEVSDSQDETAADTIEVAAAPDTPSKAPRARGRPKGSKNRARTPTPPPEDLPPHELFFFQNRPGTNKTSAHTLPPNALLNHETYFSKIQECLDGHAEDAERLTRIHARGFEQWAFELDEGFNICLYGYGSKRELALSFAEYLHTQGDESKNAAPKIVVVNGYAPGLTLRDILTTLATAALPKNVPLPAQPAAISELVLSVLTVKPPAQPIYLFINSLDHVSLRKPASIALLARLACHHSISLVATCDSPSFPLLFSTSLAQQFRFAYHDATTFAPYTAELEVVEDVNVLLGRSARRLGGKDGVIFVLRSLPENARSLYKLLVEAQLALGDIVPTLGFAFGGANDDDDEDMIGTEDEDAAMNATPSRKPRRGRPAKNQKATLSKKAAASSPPEGVEYRTLYHQAVEQFVCSSEVGFRTLLKEFHDHRMVESRVDATGTERLLVPFAREELEALLEEDGGL
ncbi:Hypothetical protein R9X50_00365100 [Acrodontium crateriforme]|uniref:Origin recognition complex subunit 2 n=1 Tax=Acrodontium crateriforme TaxID=150365 RepID=A0AAQ3M6K7_9PEZI|nr:Hypothetical protein R9X50_00365100 [Acrodontium crateriforme]